MNRRTRRAPHPVVAQLRADREAAGAPRPRFARDHGIPLRTLEAWEWGLVSPTLDVLATYARRLGYDITLTPRQEE
ncbi:helix-turn-helix domain-containing protein [Nocardiopsis protaetiae]|uniref:helix-turn-helix domain-containing protein n=1 Tax=Nocardiopsis protaetiae TaxID=3382270 RepID=UPI00387AF5A3